MTIRTVTSAYLAFVQIAPSGSQLFSHPNQIRKISSACSNLAYSLNCCKGRSSGFPSSRRSSCYMPTKMDASSAFHIDTTRLSDDAFRQYLQTCRNHAIEVKNELGLGSCSSGSGDKVHVVLGNQAADLDSIVSALIYGFILSSLHSPTSIVIPLANIHRDDVALRTETTYLLNQLQLSPDQCLNTLDDLDLAALHQADRLCLHLVDHNTLTSSQRFMENTVQSVVDHHVNERRPGENLERKIIEPMGSTCTLVAEIMESLQLFQHRFLDATMLVDVKILLLSTILIDTTNLNPGVGRATTRDKEIAAKLGQQLEQYGIRADALYHAVREAKISKDHLTASELLRSDYKDYNMSAFHVGISSVSKAVTEFSAQDIVHFAISKKLPIFLLMTSYQNQQGDFHREIAFYCQDAKQLHNLIQSVETADCEPEHKIRLIPITRDDYSALHVAVYDQKNLKITRKILQPILDTAMKSLQMLGTVEN